MVVREFVRQERRNESMGGEEERELWRWERGREGRDD